MKVNSIHGRIPEAARPPVTGPGIKTQTDIVNHMRPRNDMQEKTFLKDELPILSSEEALYGPELDKEVFANFVRNTLRSRPLIQDWLLSTGDDFDGNVQWRVLVDGKNIQKYNTAGIGTILADALAPAVNVAAVSVSTTKGIAIGISSGAVSGDPSLTVWYKKVS
jgi:hypothetical protein